MVFGPVYLTESLKQVLLGHRFAEQVDLCSPPRWIAKVIPAFTGLTILPRNFVSIVIDTVRTLTFIALVVRTINYLREQNRHKTYFSEQQYSL